MRAAESHKYSRKNYIGCPLLARNEKFVARVQELQKIHDHLNPAFRSRGQRCCAVLALAGTGKTSIANEHFSKDQSSYTFAAWLRASDDVTIAQDIAKLAEKSTVGARDQVTDLEIFE